MCAPERKATPVHPSRGHLSRARPPPGLPRPEQAAGHAHPPRFCSHYGPNSGQPSKVMLGISCTQIAEPAIPGAAAMAESAPSAACENHRQTTSIFVRPIHTRPCASARRHALSAAGSPWPLCHNQATSGADTVACRPCSVQAESVQETSERPPMNITAPPLFPTVVKVLAHASTLAAEAHESLHSAGHARSSRRYVARIKYSHSRLSPGARRPKQVTSAGPLQVSLRSYTLANSVRAQT